MRRLTGLLGVLGALAMLVAVTGCETCDKGSEVSAAPTEKHQTDASSRPAYISDEEDVWLAGMP